MKAEQTAILYPKRSKCAPVLSVRESDAQYMRLVNRICVFKHSVMKILTAHAQPFRGARDLAFCLKVPLDSLLVWASSGGSGETARMRRFAWTFAARIGDKYQIRLTRPNHVIYTWARQVSCAARAVKVCYRWIFRHIFSQIKGYLKHVLHPLYLSLQKWAASWQNQQNDCAPSEDSDQPGHQPSLISLRCALSW